MITDLEQEVNRVATAHARLVRAAEAKLRDFGIPKEELGFEPQGVPCDVVGGGRGREKGLRGLAAVAAARRAAGAARTMEEGKGQERAQALSMTL